MFPLLVMIAIVLLSSGLCSGSEAALFSVPLLRVRQLAQSDDRSAQILLQIREQMSRPIATIVILNNIANIVGSITVGVIATNVLGDQWLGVFSGILTFLVIVFAEIIPKTLGERYAEPIALRIAIPIAWLTTLFTPLVWLLEQLTAPFTKGDPYPTTNETEITMLARIGQQEGIIEADESEMIQRVFRMNDVKAVELMTPRVTVTYIAGALPLIKAKEEIIASSHSRIIVIGESIEDILGTALKSELLTAIVEMDEALESSETVAQYVRPVEFIPPNVPADDLLRFFRRSRQHLAVVIDEFGGVAGVVTLEDVLETLTGAIMDETDEIADLRAEARSQTRSWLSRANRS